MGIYLNAGNEGFEIARNSKIYVDKSELISYTNEALRMYIAMNFDGLKDAIVQMLGGEACKVNIAKFQNDMSSFRTKDDVLTLLIHLGYLAYKQRTQEVFIPNEEIRLEFINAIEDLWMG